MMETQSRQCPVCKEETWKSEGICTECIEKRYITFRRQEIEEIKDLLFNLVSRATKKCECVEECGCLPSNTSKVFDLINKAL